jgi:hypothetical protein
MKHGRGNLGAKKPRYHPVLAWEANNLSNEFTDISRMALDSRYGHNAALLTKRKRGLGPTNGKTPGLFGLGGVIDYKSKQSAFNTGIILAVSVYGVADFYINRGHDLKLMQRRIARWPVGLALMSFTYILIAPNSS